MTTVVEEGGLIGCCCEQNKTDPSGGQGRGGSAGWWVDEQYPRNHRGRYLIMRRITLIKISCHALSVCGSAANWMTDRLCCTLSHHDHHGRRRVASAAAVAETVGGNVVNFGGNLLRQFVCFCFSPALSGVV